MFDELKKMIAQWKMEKESTLFSAGVLTGKIQLAEEIIAGGEQSPSAMTLGELGKELGVTVEEPQPLSKSDETTQS
jgi:hypothetical protein